MKATRIVIALPLVAASVLALGFCWPFASRGEGLTLHGTVEIQEVRLSSKMGGRVKALLVSEGSVVEAGQPLIELEAPELEAQKVQVQARLLAASALFDKAISGARPEEKRLAAAALQAAEARWRKHDKGFRTEEIDESRSELASAGADLQRAQQALEREQALYPRASSKADYDAAVAAVTRHQGQVNAARARLQLLTHGYRVEDVAEAKAELERARASWELVEAGTRSEDIAELEARVAELGGKLQEIEVQLREATVTAPEKVLVEVLPVRRGDVVAPNQPVARVLRAVDLWVKAFVPEVELGKVRLGQRVRVRCDAVPGRACDGSIVHIAAASEFTPRNVQSYDERRHQVFAIKIRVVDDGGVFKSGMAAEVQIPLANEEK
jgi:HlyD family secretion protein